MVKYSSAIFVVALIAAPVFAFATEWDDLETRDLSEIPKVFDRDLTNTKAVYARELDELFARVSEDLEARDFEYQDLSARHIHISEGFKKFLGKVWGGIKKFTSAVLGRRENSEELEAREFEELEDRELDALIQRHFEQIEERSPGFTQHVNNMARGLEERDLDLDLDLLNREFEEYDLFERDFDDFEDMFERDFEDDFQEREIDGLD